MKEFHVGDILSLMTGFLVSPSGMDGLHSLAEYMAGESVWTHQLPRVMDECKEPLGNQFPDLRDVAVPERFDGADHVWRWLAEVTDKHGETRMVAPLPSVDHTSVDPLAELKMMAPHVQVLAVEVKDQ